MTLKRLHESIEQHDTKEVKQILQEFVDVNCIYCQETALTKAIRIREQDIVNAILEHQYCNVHAGNQFDRTPLYYAALDGNTNLTKILLEKGSDVNQADIGGVTPLAATAWYDNWETADVLIKWGAALDNTRNKGETPLHRACSSLSLGVVEILINSGSDVNCKTIESKTPLIATVLANDNGNAICKLKRIRIMTLLLDNGADPNIQDNSLCSALHYVVEVNDIHAACLLMEYGCNMYLSNNDNSSPFDIAVSCGKQHFYLAIMFFVNGFYLPAVDSKTIRGILFQNKYNDTDETIRKLLLSIILEEVEDFSKFVSFYEGIIQNEANLTNLNPSCLQIVKQHPRRFICPTSLEQRCRAIIRAHLGIPFLNNLRHLNLPTDLKTFLSFGIDIRVSSKETCNLYLAIESNYNSEVQQYLERNSLKDVVHEGQTPLMRASFVNNISAVEYLLHIKADCDYQNHHGDTMLHIAARQDHVDIVRLVLGCDICKCKRNTTGNLPFQEALIHGNIECALLLLSYCSSTDINILDVNGISPLHYAVGNGSVELTSRLLQKGACVNQPDMYGNTALHVAGTKGAIYLRENIELPALFDSKISSVMTSMSVIMCDTSEISQKCGNFFNNQRNILNLLLEAGCDVNILNNNSKKALDLAKEYGFHDIVLL